MPYLYPVTRRYLNKVRITHLKAVSSLKGEEWRREKADFNGIVRLERYASKKSLSINGQNYLRELCKQYLVKYGEGEFND